MSKDLVCVKRALISVSDKTRIENFAKELLKWKIEIVSTGGTASFLKEKGVPVTEVSDITNFPELMDGRLKTLHPIIHGGLLGLRENKSHLLSMQRHNIPEIDLLVVNLYPFEKIMKTSDSSSKIIENIDIGGPAMIRAGAKNHKYVSVLVEHQDFDNFLIELSQNSGCTSGSFRRSLAEIAFARTAEYDGLISQWMNDKYKNKEPRRLIISGRYKKGLRYGENPHQSASYYQINHVEDMLNAFHMHQGKELSFNNLNDLNSAIEVIREFEKEKRSLAVIIKHTNTCGVAIRNTPHEAYLAAVNCDRLSAFGGIVAFNVNIDLETAKEVCSIFTEIVIAPSADADAIVEFSKKKNLRFITINKSFLSQTNEFNFRQVTGGLLVQDKDVKRLTLDDISIVTSQKPSEDELKDMFFAWKIAKCIKSNAIVFALNTATIGIGAGQMSRVDSTRIAKIKAHDMTKFTEKTENITFGSVAASDAFFPFADSIFELAQAGIKAVIQPGGSINDTEVIAAANASNISMVFTNLRHFKH